jgi:hypothetical protein
VNLKEMLARFTEHWQPKQIARINDYDVRLVKVQVETAVLLLEPRSVVNTGDAGGVMTAAVDNLA